MKKKIAGKKRILLIICIACYFLAIPLIFHLTGIAMADVSLPVLIIEAAGLVVIVSWLPVIFAISSSLMEALSPLSLQAIGYLMFFVLPAVHIAMFPEWDYFQVSDFFPKVLRLLTLGYICLLIGYYSKIGFIMADILRTKLPFPNYNLDARSATFTLWWIYTIGWIARIVLIMQSAYYHTAQSDFRFTEIGNLIGQIEWLCKLMFIFFLVRYFIRPKSASRRLTIFAVGTTEVFYNLLAGNRQQLMELFVYTLIVYSMIRRVVPWKEALIISLLLIVFMFPFVAQYRSIIGYQYYVTGDIDILGAMKGFISLLSSGKIDILDGIHQTMNRNADIVPVAAIIRDTPRYIDFQYGRTYLGLLFFFIPRVIWPEKPSLLTAVWTTERYLGINPYNYSIAPTTLFGEFYLNFGELGVFFGMAVWGMFLRFIYSYTKPACSKNASYLIFYVFMSVYFLWVSQTAAVTIVAIRAWIIIYFVSAIIKAFSPRKSLLAK